MVAPDAVYRTLSPVLNEWPLVNVKESSPVVKVSMVDVKSVVTEGVKNPWVVPKDDSNAATVTNVPAVTFAGLVAKRMVWLLSTWA